MNNSSDDYIKASIDRIMPKGAYRSTDSNAIAVKVTEDIKFLQDRIARIKKLQTPNSSVLKTYQAMLDSREAVLQWLQNKDADDNAEQSDNASVEKVFKAG